MGVRKSTRTLPLSSSTTAIGSLPHHNIDSALAFAFRPNIPFLPQIPIRNPWEFMIAQALEGMPGLEIEKDGSTALNLDVWIGRTKTFNERLLTAYEHSEDPEAFAAFEPSSAASSSWQPFLWELEERKVTLAKLQIAGPLTAQWVLRLKDGSPTDKHTDVSAQIYRLVLARALAMCRRLFAVGIQPILYLDEPGLYAFSSSNARHMMSLQELKLMIQALKKEGVIVGLHCCSNTNWAVVFSLGLDILSIDTSLSLESLLEQERLVEAFVLGGGRMSLGVIPTARDTEEIHELNARQIFTHLREAFQRRFHAKEEITRKILSEAIYTPACGLALHDPKEAETILETLMEFQQISNNSLL